MTEHPIEVARKALFEAAAVEHDADWAGRMRRFGELLPSRAPLPDGYDADNVVPLTKGSR